MNIINLGIQADKPSAESATERGDGLGRFGNFESFGNHDLTDNTTGVVDPMETNGTPSQYSKLADHVNDRHVLGSPNLPAEELCDIPDTIRFRARAICEDFTRTYKGNSIVQI
jgi:hypothetical protein